MTAPADQSTAFPTAPPAPAATAPVPPGQVNTTPDTPFNVTEDNKYAGTFVIEAFDELIKSINEEAESQTDAVLNKVFSTLGAASAVAETALDPIGAGFGAAFGWLLEHFPPCRDAIQLITGRPDVVMGKSEDTTKLAGEMRVLADDHLREMANFTGWAGISAEQYRASMQELNQELRAMATGTETKARILAVGAVLLALVYDEVRDMLAMIMGTVVSVSLQIAATAASLGAAAPLTAPAIGAGIAKIGRVVAAIVELAGKLGKGLAKLGELLGKLEGALKMIGKAWEKVETLADVGEVGYELYKANNGVTTDINDAVAADGAKDQANAELAGVKALGNDAIAANEEYKAAKDGEEAAAKNAQKWGDYVNTQSAEAKTAGDAAQAAADAANAAAKDTEAKGDALEKAAKSGDRDAFDAAKKEYDAAKDTFESANDKFENAQSVAKKEAAETTEAAKGYAKEAANVAAWAEVSSKEIAETDAPTDAAQNASDAFQNKYKNTDGGIVGAIFNGVSDAGKFYSDNANDSARNDQKSYEAANLDAAHKNAAAAAANAKAMETGSAADIAAADNASYAAKTSGEAAQAAGQKAYASGQQAQETYEKSKELADVANVANGGKPAQDRPTTGADGTTGQTDGPKVS